MIKIQEHLNRVDADAYLDALAKSLWESLNPKLKSGKGYKQTSLIEKCKKYREQSKSKAYRIKYANNNVNEAKRHKDFFAFLLASNAAQLKRLIISRPNQFATIRTTIYKVLQPSDLFNGIGVNLSQTAFGVLLSETIFNYTALRSSIFCKELFTKISMNAVSCPYCNDNNLKIVKIRKTSSKDTKLKAYLDLDHFYSKSVHPYFAVSFFNLIPTCHDCNSGDKGDKPFTIETHVHPYYEAFDDFYRFKISLKALLGDPLDEIAIEKFGLKPLDITLDNLQLEARYSVYLSEAEKLVKFFSDYKAKYVGTPEENFFTEAIFDLKGVPQYKKDILKHQRGKMNRDILRQIDIANVLKLG
jgi:hypothetical protein